jgi:hypothetical protein
MLQCRTCGEVFPGIYIPEGSTTDFKASATNADTSHRCSITTTLQQIIWIGLDYP